MRIDQSGSRNERAIFPRVSTVKSFEEGVSEERPDVALLDIMLPDGQRSERAEIREKQVSGSELYYAFRASKEEDKVNGLNMGADDYIAKPFSVLELTARVNARLRDKQKPAVLCGGERDFEYGNV